MVELPPAAVTAHNTGAWHSKSGAVKEYRESAHELMVTQHRSLVWAGSIRYKVRIHHEWFLAKTFMEARLGSDCPKKWRKYRPLDEGNAIQALKPAIDGIVDSGVLADDKAGFVEWGRFVRRSLASEHKGLSGVLLTLEVLDVPTPERKKRKLV